VAEVPGGTVDPGKLVSGLARAAQRHGAIIAEHCPVREITFNDSVDLAVPGRMLRARQVLFATNAQSLELSELVECAQPKFTLAVATRPLGKGELEALGLHDRKAFYTVDLPYLWGCVLPDHKVVWGSGLVHIVDWRELDSIDVSAGRPAELLASLERRVRGLHPVLRDVEFCHRWGGPILIAESWQPVFDRHPRCPQALILGGYSGHGVALSVYLARWAAEALLGQRELPDWGKLEHG
jgi:glycine/D-amino acid oxidase-like deaminating enzyme